jgi:hypothetical protein
MGDDQTGAVSDALKKRSDSNVPMHMLWAGAFREGLAQRQPACRLAPAGNEETKYLGWA